MSSSRPYHKSPYDAPAFGAIYRTTKSFDIWPNAIMSSPTPLHCVGDLVDAVVDLTSIPADKVVEVSRIPSRSELDQEARRLVWNAFESIDAQLPETTNSGFDLNGLLPTEHRAEKWRKISEMLDCELPLLRPTMWQFGLVFMMVWALMLSAWVGLLYAFELNEDPTTAFGWIVDISFSVGMYVVSILIAGMAAEMATPRHRIPFDSMDAMVEHVRFESEERLEAKLRRSITSTIDDFVVDVISEEFNSPRSEITREFSLYPTDSATDT
jgi:hypothetical protein